MTLSSRSGSRRKTPALQPGQLTIFGRLDSIARKAEVDDPQRPATRLFLTVLAMMGVGLLVQVSHASTTLSPREFHGEVVSQVLFRIAGLILLVAGFRIGPHGLRRFIPYLLLGSGILLVLVFVEPFGVMVNGSHRWVDLGVRFQPSELARIAVVLWIADRCLRLGPRVQELRHGALPMLLLILVFFLLILIETDLGGSFLLLGCGVSVMWVGGARFKRVMFTSMVAVGGGVIVAAVGLVPYMRERMAVYLGLSRNDQVANTMEAMVGGGLFGNGFSQGIARARGVPYLESDYVFSQVGEELGLVGMLLVLGLVLSYLWFSLRLVLSTPDRFEALVAFGLLLSIAFQAMIHVQVSSGLAPPKGMTLPFISDGGTSLIVSSLAVGLALGAARRHSPILRSLGSRTPVSQSPLTIQCSP